MPIITISRGCYSHGKEIAECVAAKLGYECISKEIILETARKFGYSEEKFENAIHNAPGFLERFSHQREALLDFVQAALLEHVVKDNVVYHGYAGQLLLPGVRHILKVRIFADMETRIAYFQEKKGISREKTLKLIDREDQNRLDWYRHVYRKDMTDPALYDMVLHVGSLTVQDACEIICTTVRSGRFDATPESLAAVRDLALSTHVKAVLEEIAPSAEVDVADGVVRVAIKSQKVRATDFSSADTRRQVQDQIKKDAYREVIAALKRIPGVKEVSCEIDAPHYT